MRLEPQDLNLPKRQANYRFALTPLADAMFQLLIFFMLSSSLTPYSFLTLKSAAPVEQPADLSDPGPNPGDAPPPPPTAPSQTALWTVEPDAVLVAGQRFAFDNLADLADALGSDGAPAKVILVVRPDARVQDVTSVLESLENANIASLQVAPSTGG